MGRRWNGFGRNCYNVVMKIEVFTEGKNTSKNEDSHKYNETCVVLADGSTDKFGVFFENKSGGEIVSQLVCEKAIETDKNGLELVSYLTEQIESLYREINPEAITDKDRRFSTTFICARVVGEKLIVTQVGDSYFRVNEKETYRGDTLIDELNSKLRSLYIEKTGDITGGRDYILPLLKNQNEYQNNSESPLGYGALDGTLVPEKFVHVFEFDLRDLHTVELVSDGYFSIPPEAKIEAYEAEYHRIELLDPDKCKTFLSTKSKDDRTVVIARF
jgi:serine/threonine protein phosphatase PrpC